MEAVVDCCDIKLLRFAVVKDDLLGSAMVTITTAL